MSPRPDVSEERRTQILEAAMAVFARQGFDQARMDDIAQEVGLSKGALYLYYKSKDAIISAILQFFFSQAMKKLQGFLESEEQPSVREQLLRLNQYYIAEMKWMVSLLPLSFEFYAVAARQKTVRQFFKRYFKDYREVLAALVQRGIDRGEFRPVLAESVAIAITALYEGLTLLWMVDPDATQWEQTGESSLLLLLDGLALPR
ncbi:MAG TPA: TetR/AcrR family transcriptional regulator [Ktedonobacteraceae bacterium]|nr:TetR/AcrR family transcriptional regulator [Ktedonobacteraceae bacterium]